MNISILLPYKENYSPTYAGAVSLFVYETYNKSKFKKNIKIFGNTNFSLKLSNNYVNLEIIDRSLFESQSKYYVNKFIEFQKKIKSDIIEIHNRPNYLKLIENLNSKIVLYFHNDPLEMDGSKKIKERIYLMSKCEKIIFNSQWSKNRFINRLDKFYTSSPKLEVINQCTSKKKVEISKKQKLITFVGKLNKAKGYDLFGNAIIKILNKYPNWKANVIGDEPREKLNFINKNLFLLGFQNHKKVLKILEYSSIAVVCSMWDEPFGRTSLEASSRGCAVIISDKGGLKETVTNAIIIKKPTIDNVYKSIEKLIRDKRLMLNLQKNSLKNFFLTNEFITKKIDNYRSDIIYKKFKTIELKKSSSKLKIIHITNFNERHNGRLFYNTGKRINNGFIRLGHSVLEFSDRDILSYHRKFNDINGSKFLNTKLLNIIGNYSPDIIILGHADLIHVNTLKTIKLYHPQIKFAQWFLDRMDSKWDFNKKRFLEKLNLMDANFCTTSPDVLKFNNKKKIYYIPNPVDQSFEKLHNYKYKNLQNDVFFAMSHGVHRGVLKKGKFDEREIFLNKLVSKLPNIKFDFYGVANKQPIWADDFIVNISNSKIALNLSQGNSLKYYTSDRLSQLMGNGLLVMIDKKTQFGDFFSKNEIVLYSDLNDLSKKINYFINNDNQRKKIAKNGRDKYFKYFNSKIIANFILDKTFNVKKKYFWEKKK